MGGLGMTGLGHIRLTEHYNAATGDRDDRQVTKEEDERGRRGGKHR